MAKEWSVKLNETVTQAREQEKTRAQQALERHKAEFTENETSVLQVQLADKD